MTTQAWTNLAVLVGPTLLFVTYLLSRRAQTESTNADAMAKQVASALATTETMRNLLSPMEDELAEMRVELIALRTHISTLEALIRDLGHNPPPLPFGRTK